MRLTSMVGELPGFSVIGEAANGQQALDFNNASSPDIVLLDIHMPGIDGIRVAQQLSGSAEPPAIIFCTAYDEHALAAFEAQAIGYLLKPVKREQLLTALQRAQTVNRAQLSNFADGPGSGARSSVSARTANGYQLIPLGQVRAFIADKKYVTAYHSDGLGSGEVLLDDTLRDLEQEFGESFVRIHRNALVAKAHILALEKQPDGACVLRLDNVDVAPVVSRRHLSEIRRLVKHL